MPVCCRRDRRFAGTEVPAHSLQEDRVAHSTSKKKTTTWIGFVRIDMFNLSIPVFDRDETRLKVFARKGVETIAADEPINGMACMDRDSDGTRILSHVITPEASVCVWCASISRAEVRRAAMWDLPDVCGN